MKPLLKIALIPLLISTLISCGMAKSKSENPMNSLSDKMELATIGGGCFWCIEAVFLEVRGIQSSTSGYSGGHIKNPAYREVTTGSTGHAEVVQLKFDPDVISYEQILEIFFHLHDPTTLNRQGADVGTQYRSVIFFHDEAQEKTAQEVFAQIEESDLWPNPLVTQIEPMKSFYVAEDYHQNYYRNNPNQPYCTYVISPKMTKLRALFKDRIQE